MGTSYKRLENKDDMMIVKGLPADVVIFNNEEDGNPYRFEYAAGEHFFDTDLMKFFAWESNSKGSSNDWNEENGNGGGRYCKQKTKGTQLTVECYFPCMGA